MCDMYTVQYSDVRMFVQRFVTVLGQLRSDGQCVLLNARSQVSV